MAKGLTIKYTVLIKIIIQKILNTSLRIDIIKSTQPRSNALFSKRAVIIFTFPETSTCVARSATTTDVPESFSSFILFTNSAIGKLYISCIN
uniref:Uncharacterized protein n=1 Tax=viral metagenome TaxID=1070528 RepID=A0A6C0B3Y2_9ZZZZ